MFHRDRKQTRPWADRRRHRSDPAAPSFEPLEPRTLLSAATLGEALNEFTFNDADGDRVTVRLNGPGTANITLDNDAADNADIDLLALTGSTSKTRLRVSVEGDGATTQIGAITTDGPAGRFELPEAGVSGAGIELGGSIRRIDLFALTGGALIYTPGDLGKLYVATNVNDALVLAGATLEDAGDLTTGRYQPATIGKVEIGGDVIDSVIAAGGDPGDDGLFADGEFLPGGRIKRLSIGGVIAGIDSPHVNPGVYAERIDGIKVAGVKFKDASLASAATIGTAVIDPLPSAANALDIADVEDIIERGVAQATLLGVNATISVIDREGNPLGIARMMDAALPAAATTVEIDAGGDGGLEAIDGLIPTSVIATTKAGTAAFLSTSRGNAFTTRTAGLIIQKHFPPGVFLQDGGPLFGVQLSSLPTSDVNRLPLGLSADPGGLPLYRGGELIGGIGVEVDGIYTVDTSGVGGSTTIEEKIALAGQIGLHPPKNIRADRVFVDGIRLDYANGKPPKLRSLGPVADYATLVAAATVDELFAPRVTPLGITGRGSKFEPAMLATPNGAIIGEVPDGSRAPGGIGLDFFDEVGGTLAFLDGALNGPEQLTSGDVATILGQGHALNHRLRAQIRRDDPQRSQVSVAVVDLDGNVLGVFRTPDAPVFGYDVAVQKARTAAFFSRPDAATELTALDGEVEIPTLQAPPPPLGAIVDPGVADPYGRHVDAAAAIGVALDGSVAVADRTGGFLSRPNLPDGIDGAMPGPFTALPPDAFSPFNTGLQTILAIPQLAEFLLAFDAVGDEAMALAMFADGTLGGGGVVPLDSNAGGLNPGGGLPENSLANGMQIFAGSVPLYKNGVLVGGVGVSGDGIEQDDFIAFSGAQGFQDFGPGVTRADQILIAGGIRLPYVKLPRAPFEGL